MEEKVSSTQLTSIGVQEHAGRFHPSLSVKFGRVQDATSFLLQYSRLNGRRLTSTRNGREEGTNGTELTIG